MGRRRGVPARDAGEAGFETGITEGAHGRFCHRQHSEAFGELMAAERKSRDLAVALLAAGLCLAQQAPREPALPAFHAQTGLVMIPFQVSQGKSPVTDLQSAGIVLLEDGVARGFTSFEGPQDHVPLELVLLFDTTTGPWAESGISRRCMTSPTTGTKRCHRPLSIRTSGSRSITSMGCGSSTCAGPPPIPRKCPAPSVMCRRPYMATI
ncbi:hypothetical protein SBA3_960017 [Candidatus Sulfopaludibacter sp. SbA3]|nr:hypothetical protein SBA3_960017 [Candidatus Sulfopaludibacter sp. SbA3]